jgi:hypothetical protein
MQTVIQAAGASGGFGVRESRERRKTTTTCGQVLRTNPDTNSPNTRNGDRPWRGVSEVFGLGGAPVLTLFPAPSSCSTVSTALCSTMLGASRRPSRL